MRELEQQTAKLELERADAQQQLEVVTANLESLNQMVSFSTNAGQADLNRGVLNAESLTHLTTFSMEQRRELAGEQHRLRKQVEELDKQLKLVSWQWNQATSGQQSVDYQAKIFVESTDGAPGTVRLNYVVGGCGWSPQYTVHGRLGDENIDLQYSALVSQMSGEDWQQVQLALSTASPAISSARPVLTPLRVVSVSSSELKGNAKLARSVQDPFSDPIPGQVDDGQDDRLSAMLQSLRAQQREVELMLESERVAAEFSQRDLALNSLAGQMQQIELQAGAKSWRTVAPDAGDDVSSQVYDLKQPVSLATRREQQLVRVIETRLAGEMYHVATPLLSTYAYREVQVTNTEPHGAVGWSRFDLPRQSIRWADGDSFDGQRPTTDHWIRS